MTCLLCVFMTRHEYGADSSSAAAANDGMAQETTSALLPGVSPDMFACFESSFACSKFAMLFGKTEEAPLPVRGRLDICQKYLLILPPVGQEEKIQSELTNNSYICINK